MPCILKIKFITVITAKNKELLLKMALAIARAIEEAKKVSGPSKSLDFVHRDHLESLKWPI